MWPIAGSNVPAHKAAAVRQRGKIRCRANRPITRWGSKIHLLTDGAGLPIAVEISAGQAHESRFFEPLLTVQIAQPARGRPARLAGDGGYSFPRIRAWLRAHHIKTVIPSEATRLVATMAMTAG